VKLDVEGAEAAIITHMLRHVPDHAMNRIDVMAIEWHDWLLPKSFRRFRRPLMRGLQRHNITLLGWRR